MTLICDGDGLDGSVNGPVGLHDHVTGAAHVVPQVVVENCGDPPVLDQRQVVPVKIVGDEHPALPVHELEGVQDRLVSSADGVDRGDLGVFTKNGDGLVADGRVDPVGVGGFDEGAATSPFPHRGSETHLALLLTAKRATAQRHQDRVVVCGEPLVHEVRRGRAGGPVVDADIGDSLAQGDVGDQRDHRNPGVVQPSDRITDLGLVRCLEDDPHRTAVADVVEGSHQLAGPRLLPEVESRSHDCRPEHGQLELQGGLDGGGEPVGSLHDEVDDEGAAVETKLAALPVEIGDRLCDVRCGAGPHAGSLVQHAVDGRLAQAGLAGDLTDRVRV